MNVLFILSLSDCTECYYLVPFFNLLFKIINQNLLSFHLHFIVRQDLRSCLMLLCFLEKVFHKCHNVPLDQVLLLLSLCEVRLDPRDFSINLFSVNFCILEVTKDVLRLQLLLQVVLRDDIWDQFVIYKSAELIDRINLLTVTEVLWHLPLLLLNFKTLKRF